MAITMANRAINSRSMLPPPLPVAAVLALTDGVVVVGAGVVVPGLLELAAAVTATEADAIEVPPPPVQFRTNVEAELSAVEVVDPLVD